MPIYKTLSDYRRFLSLIDFYRFGDQNLSFSRYLSLPMEERENFTKSLRKSDAQVEIFAYCLMPNHFHFLLRQVKDNGIRRMLSNVQNGYGKYFNLKNERNGPIFESRFKALRLETDEEFLHVSRYIHLNPSTSYLVEPDSLLTYEWSSFPEYMGKRESVFIDKDLVLALGGRAEKYKDFVLNQAEYQRELNKIKHALLE